MGSSSASGCASMSSRMRAPLTCSSLRKPNSQSLNDALCQLFAPCAEDFSVHLATPCEHTETLMQTAWQAAGKPCRQAHTNTQQYTIVC